MKYEQENTKYVVCIRRHPNSWRRDRVHPPTLHSSFPFTKGFGPWRRPVPLLHTFSVRSCLTRSHSTRDSQQRSVDSLGYSASTCSLSLLFCIRTLYCDGHDFFRTDYTSRHTTVLLGRVKIFRTTEGPPEHFGRKGHTHALYYCFCQT